jgi:hypothetical protein
MKDCGGGLDGDADDADDIGEMQEADRDICRMTTATSEDDRRDGMSSM